MLYYIIIRIASQLLKYTFRIGMSNNYQGSLQIKFRLSQKIYTIVHKITSHDLFTTLWQGWYSWFYVRILYTRGISSVRQNN